MNVNSANVTTPFTSSSTLTQAGESTFSRESVSETLKVVDQVSLSSKSLFLFELNTYANSLSDEGRNQFADALEQSGDPIFSQGFLDSVRHSMAYGGVFAGDGVIGSEAASGDQFGVIAMYGGDPL
ncbi:MAG TPA: hypothetical protein VIC26_10960 [Marinagarivorans sp.]